MKKTLTLRNALTLSFFATILFTACSKDKIEIPQDNSTITSTSEATSITVTAGSGNSLTGNSLYNGRVHIIRENNDSEDDIQRGSVSLAVTPADALYGVIIYNDNFAAEIYPTDGTGLVSFDRVPAGIYNVIVIPGLDSYRKSFVSDVQVAENANTDLGTITLEN
jgi:hypothetical protein